MSGRARVSRTPASVSWWMNEGVPNYGPAEWKALREPIFSRIEALAHFEQRPIAVQVFGDTAIYQFWATWTQVDANGQHLTQTKTPLGRSSATQRRPGVHRWCRCVGIRRPVTRPPVSLSRLPFTILPGFPLAGSHHSGRQDPRSLRDPGALGAGGMGEVSRRSYRRPTRRWVG